MSLMIHPPEETLDCEIKSLTTIREKFLEFSKLRDEVERLAIEFLQQSPRMGAALEVIVNEVCHCRLVSKEEIYSRRRTDRIATARHLVWWLARDICRGSLMAIGKAFSRDHGAILHGCRHIANRMETEPAFASIVNITKATVIERLRER